MQDQYEWAFSWVYGPNVKDISYGRSWLGCEAGGELHGSSVQILMWSDFLVKNWGKGGIQVLYSNSLILFLNLG